MPDNDLAVGANSKRFVLIFFLLSNGNARQRFHSEVKRNNWARCRNVDYLVRLEIGGDDELNGRRRHKWLDKVCVCVGLS